MKTKSIENLIIIFSLLLMAMSSINQAKAEIIFEIWEENFEDDTWADNWDLVGYLRDSENVNYESVDSGFSVVNGVLIAPNTQGNMNTSGALHNSNVAYGNWSFDWYAKEGNVNPTFRPWDVVCIMWTDSTNNYNYTGMTEADALMYSKGYYLEMDSYSSPDRTALFFGVLKFPHYETITGHYYDYTLTGSHHFDITRNLQGQFKVYHNSELMFQETDNSSTTSEKFGYTSYNGESGIDNITVSDSLSTSIATTISTSSTTSSNSSSTITTTPETTEGYIVWVLAQSLIVLAVLRKKMKK